MEMKYNYKRQIGENEINRIFGDIIELQEVGLVLGFLVDVS